MDNKIIISGLIFHGYCGISMAEKEIGCKFSVYMEAGYDMERAVVSDSITEAVDYSKVSETILAIGRESKFSLLEAMASTMADALLKDFPKINQLVLRVEKLLPPIEEIKDYFAVEITRAR